MLVAAKFGDPVLGVDIHMVLIPAPPAPPIPTPLPHPFIGVVFDPIGLAMGCLMSAVFGGGGPVLINSMPCGNTGTEVKGVPHFPTPPGISFAPNDIPGNEGVLFMGSLTVNMGGDSIARLTDMVISCNFPINLPTSVCLAVPMGPPVLVGGPPAINFLAAATQMIRTKWVSDQLHSLLKAKPGSRLSKVICFFTGHPVDVMTGEVVTDRVDFELPGPLPLVFERNYYSRSTHDGPLGPGWHHTLDASVCDEGWRVVVRLPDGRERWHDPIAVGASHVDLIERYTLRRHPWGWELATAKGVTWSFAPTGAGPRCALVRVADRNDNALQLRYVDAHLDTLVDSAGRTLRFTHHGGRLVGVHVQRERGAWTDLVRFSYDEEGRLSAAADPMGAEHRYAYEGGVLTRETDRNGVSFHFEYDWAHPEGWCVRTWGDGGIYDRQISYDKHRHVTMVRDSRDGVTQYFGNADGLVVKRVDPMGGAWTFEYDEHLRRVAEIDPLGARWAWAFDDRGNIAQETDPLGNVTRWTFDTRGLPSEATDALGQVWQRVHDTRGTLTRSIDPGGNTWEYFADGRGLLTGWVDPLLHRHRIDRDDMGNVTGYVTPEGRALSFAADDLGRRTAVTDPAGNVTALELDARGRIVGIAGVDGSRRAIQYDPEGTIVRFADGLGRETRYRASWRVVERTDPAGATVRHHFDTEGDLVAVENELGERHEIDYDLAGRVVRERCFDGRALEYRYDAAGRCVEFVNGTGARVRIERDALGRVVRKSLPDKSAYTYAFDALGRLIEARSPEATVRFAHDAAGRVVRETTDVATLESWYDAAGRRVARRSSLGHATWYSVDGDGLLREVRWGVGALAAQEVLESRPRELGAVRMTPGVLGHEAQRGLPGGLVAQWERDGAGRPRAHRVGGAAGELHSLGYQWDDERGLLASIHPSLGPTRYVRDARDAPVAELAPGQTPRVRALDLAGNVYRDPSLTDRRYGPGGVLREDAGATLTHDAAGRLVERVERDGSRWRYVWDALGQLREVTRPDEVRVTFAYDALGRRVRKSTSGREVAFVWDRDDLVHELAADAPTVSWVFEPGWYVPIAKVDGARSFAVVVDHLGAPALLSDESGSIVWRGRVDLDGGVSTDIAATACPWRFPGQYADVETGLSYNRFRYYDPRSGAYLTPDPLGLEGGLRAYGYVTDPTRYVDPLGLMPWAWNPDTGMGHHLVPRGKANSVGLSHLGTPRDTPTFFPTPYTPGMHESLHAAQAPHIGKLQGPWTGTADELLDASRAGLVGVDHMRGDLRIPSTGEVLAKDVTPTEAFDRLKKWHDERVSPPCGS
jgi:RHS repeat-associated protein